MPLPTCETIMFCYEVNKSGTNLLDLIGVIHGRDFQTETLPNHNQRPSGRWFAFPP